MAAAASAVTAYRHILRRRAGLIALLLAAIFIALLADFTTGPSALSWSELWRALSAPAAADPSTRVIVWDIRLPQALMAALVGAALGLAGAEMQTILNNPLASPFTLGVSSAAAFGASLAIVLNLGLPGVPAGWLIAGNAFLFAALAALALDAAARWAGMNTQGVVLFGIAMVFSFNALVSLVQFVASAEALQNLVFWTMGSLSRSSWASAGALAVAVALALPLALRQSWKLTALRLGEERRQLWRRRAARARGGAGARQPAVGAVRGLRRHHRLHRPGGAPYRPPAVRRGSPLLPARQRTDRRHHPVARVAGVQEPDARRDHPGRHRDLAGRHPFFVSVVMRRRLP